MDGTGVAGVTVVRNGTTVLRDVTLEAADGELLVILGSSGSGKSALLRALAGLEPVTAGQVFIRGRDVTGVPADQRRISMVFQGSALFPHMDVSRNLGWGLRIQQVPEAEVEQRVGGLARQLRLSRLLQRRPGQLSGGERGVVSIGHSLVSTPDVFLLDEPLGDLDAAQRTDVRRRIVDVVRSVGVSTFYVTHDQAEGLAVADRVALLHEGAVVQVGTPRELYERPANLLVAGFVGTPPIGLMTARLVVADGQAGFEVGRRTLPMWRPLPAPLREHVGRDVVLGLRAEDVHDAADGSAPDTVVLDGVATNVEYTGRQTVVTAAVGTPPVTTPGVEMNATSAAGATLSALFSPRVDLRPGASVRLAVEGARAHVFDVVTGRALWHPEQPDGSTDDDVSR